jgi:electron transport complex protein RnfC
LTAGAAVTDLPRPKRVILPLSQHIGAPAEPTVARGESVTRGQVVADARGFVSIPVHASVSGKVVEIDRHPHPAGGESPAVVIETDPEADESDFSSPIRDPMALSPDEIRNHIRRAGIAGLGGAAFPTHVKLSPPPEKKIDTLILNGSECEPYLTADHRLMLERPGDVLRGMAVVRRVIDSSHNYIAVEANKADVVKGLAEAAADEELEIKVLPVKYPQGAERQLIYAVTGRRVPPPPGLPMDVGCLVVNVGTAVAVYEAVAFGKPLIDRITTVSGGGIVEPKNLRVRIGTPISDLIAACGGLRPETVKLVAGGPMMGFTQHGDGAPIIKGSSGVLALTRSEINLDVELPCIRCARCVDACPMNLMPTQIAAFVDGEMFDEAEAYHVFDCIECGSCAFGCPARIKLVQRFKYVKAVLADRKRAVVEQKGAA